MLKILFTLVLILSSTGFAANNLKPTTVVSPCAGTLSLLDQSSLVGLLNNRFEKIEDAGAPTYYELSRIEPLSYASKIGTSMEWRTLLMQGLAALNQRLVGRLNETVDPALKHGVPGDPNKINGLIKSIEQIEEENFKILVEYLKAEGHRIVIMNAVKNLYFMKPNYKGGWDKIDRFLRIPSILILPSDLSLDLAKTQLTVYSSYLDPDKTFVNENLNIKFIGRNVVLNHSEAITPVEVNSPRPKYLN